MYFYCWWHYRSWMPGSSVMVLVTMRLTMWNLENDLMSWNRLSLGNGKTDFHLKQSQLLYEIALWNDNSHLNMISWSWYIRLNEFTRLCVEKNVFEFVNRRLALLCLPFLTHFSKEHKLAKRPFVLPIDHLQMMMTITCIHTEWTRVFADNISCTR